MSRRAARHPQSHCGWALPQSLAGLLEKEGGQGSPLEGWQLPRGASSPATAAGHHWPGKEQCLVSDKSSLRRLRVPSGDAK